MNKHTATHNTNACCSSIYALDNPKKPHTLEFKIKKKEIKMLRREHGKLIFI